MSDTHFPFTQTTGASLTVRISLSEEAATRLRGRWISRDHSYGGPSAAPQGDYQDQVGERGTLRVSGVQILDNGWVRAYFHFDSYVNARTRVDLLLAPGEVCAISTDVLSSSAMNEAAQDEAFELWEQLHTEFQGSAA